MRMKFILKKNMERILFFILWICFILIIDIHAQDVYNHKWPAYNYQLESMNIKSVNGNFYAYIVLLFNENPHFVNMIQKDSIPLKIMGTEGFHIREYKNYINMLKDPKLKNLARLLLIVYLEPKKFDNNSLLKVEDLLATRNIILKFTRDNNSWNGRISLDYCIFGRKIPITLNHPLLRTNEKIYNIQPFIYYDEFSTSNSTFYFDMIYINPIEVHNDYLIAKKIIKGENVDSMYFVGSRITDDIKFCLSRAFPENQNIKDEIWKMFTIHELTHKILNNQFNNFDQVTGEELSLGSTIYYNPLLGLSVLYSYLNYNAINPHRIAAMNYVRFIAKASGKNAIIDDPGLIKQIDFDDLKRIAKKHFSWNIAHLK